MTKYEEGLIYNGDIKKRLNTQDILVEKEAKLLYNADSETFFPMDHPRAIIYMDLIMNEDKLTTEEKEKYQKLFNEINYPYHNPAEDNELYIDEDSITIDKINLEAKRRG